MSLLRMSFSGAVMILVIVVIRALAIHKLPKDTFLLLWGVAALRLLIPYSLSSAFSVYSLLGRAAPAAETVAGTAGGTAQNIPAAPFAPVVPAYQPLPSPAVSAGTAATVPIDPWTVVWVVGALACTTFFAAAYCKCRREFQASLPVENESAKQWLGEHQIRRSIAIRQSGRISAPLTYGVLRPVILMPKTVDWDDKTMLNYVLTHEYVHIRRFDAVTKLTLTAALCAHWFNPAVWVMYVLANRDIELSCDEAVVRRFGERAKSAYAMALIRMEEVRSSLTPLCNNFSKNVIEERIVAIMKIKKTSLAAVIAASLLVTGVTAAFATSAKADGDVPDNEPAPTANTSGTTAETTGFSFEWTTFRYGEREYDMTLRNPSINSILSAVPAGNKIVVECHVGPHNGIYSIFDTVSETFEKDIAGHDLIWHSDDITTAVYAFWSEVYTYDGSLIKNYDLDELAVDDGMIYEMEFSDDYTKLHVTIVYDDGGMLLDIVDLPRAVGTSALSETTQDERNSNMNIPSTNINGLASGRVYGDDYYLTVSGKIKKRSDTFAGHMEKAAGKRDQYVPDSPPNTSPSITDSLIRSWAKKYDPRNMTQAEYQTFLDDLVAAGVIQDSDKIDLGYYPDLIVLDPDAPAHHEVAENDPFGHYLNLAQAGGNALDWAEFWKNYYDDGIGYTSEHVSQQLSLFGKVSSILDRMAEAE